MRRWGTWLATAAAATAVVGGLMSTGLAQADPGAQSLSGTLPDGASWVADVPASWNGTLILYSHGYGSMAARDAPDTNTQHDLLAAGYALVGSSYSGPSLWAVPTAVGDQFDSLRAVEEQIGKPRRTIAWGTSMGGLVSALESQDPRGRIDGTLTTCGLVAGALNLNDYQLAGEYALAHLLAPTQSIKLVDYASGGEAFGASQQLSSVVGQSQATPQGRARIALGAALLNEPGWFSGATAPAPRDFAGQEAQQERELTAFTLIFTMTGRQQIELVAGGNSSATAGVNFTALLGSSSQAGEVRALYRAAGLDLNADLRELTRDADIHADPRAVFSLARTSMVTGRLGVPELDIHTTDDQLVPVEQENWYGRQVARAGSASLLRQAYVDTTGHCAFQPDETIAALHAVEHRIDTGRWDDVTRPSALNAGATALHLSNSSAPRYERFTPGALVGGLGEPGREHSF